MPALPDIRRLRRRRTLAPARWLIATATVLVGIIAAWIVNPQPISIADGTGGTGGNDQPDITVSFVDSAGDPLDTVVISNDDEQADIYVAVAGMSVGVHDTVQLLLRHDESLVSIDSASCTGVFEGAFSPPGSVEVSPGESTFECGLNGGVATSDGFVASFALQRLGAGEHELELVTEGAFGTGLFSAGVLSPVLIGPSVTVQSPEVATPTAPATAGSGGTGNFSNPSAPPAGPSIFTPGLPRDVRVAPGDGAAQVSWLPPASNGGSAIIGYVLRSGDGAVSLPVSGESTTVLITGLQNGLEYRFRVQAINSIGAGPFTDPSEIVIPAGPPTAPQNVEVRLIEGSAEALISWSAPERTNGADNESYLIAEASGRTDAAILAASATSHRIELAGTGEYVFTVVATNSAGPGQAASAAVTVPEPPDSIAPVTGNDQIPRHGAPTDVSDPIRIQSLSNPEKEVLTAQLGALLPGGLEITNEPVTVTTGSGQLQVEIPIQITGKQAPIADFNGFSIGVLSVESEDGAPATAQVDLGNGIAISGDVTVSSNAERVTFSLSKMELLLTASLPPTTTDREQRIAGSVLFTTQIDSISEMPELSLLFLEEPGPPDFPSMEQIVAALQADGWPILTDEPGVDFALKIEHSGTGPLSPGDTTISFTLIEPLEPGMLLIATKQSDDGVFFSRPVTCQSSPDEPPSCSAIFDGSAGGFSTFAVLLAMPAAQPEQPTDTPAVPTAQTPNSEPTAAPVSSQDNDSTSEDISAAGSQAVPVPVPTVRPEDPVTATESPPAIEPGGLSSLVVIVAVGSVFGIAGLGGVGYFLNRRHNSTLPAFMLPLAGAAMLTLLVTTSDGQIANAAGLAADPVGGEGDIAQRSDLLRSLENLDGTGVTIGVISDSYGCDQDALQSDIAAGEVPGDVTILQEAPEIYCSLTTDRGRAMVQNIHDVAPGARIIFQTSVFGKASVAFSIPLLVSEGADIIVEDASFGDELHFQDDIVAQAIDAAVATGTLYFSSAGDDGTSAYEAAYSGSGSVPTVCSPSNPPLCIVSGNLHDFDPGAGVNQFLEVSLPAGKTSLRLHWDQPGQSAGGVANSAIVDLFAYDSSGVPIAAAVSDNSASGNPFELLSVTGRDSIQVAVSHRAGPVPGRIRLTATDGAIVAEHATNSGTISGHRNAAGAITVGSVHYSDTAAFGGTPVVEPSSSRGGVEILFAQDGSLLDTPFVRQKPDIVAPSGAATTMGPFSGSASAAAHAAAAAALLLELDSVDNLQQDQLRWLLTETAVDVGAVGPDFESGFGLIDVFEAALMLIVEPPIAISDQYTVDMNSILSVSAPGVMTNDLDLNGHSLEATVLTDPENGELVLLADGSFTYTPDVGFFGIDSFTYKVNDGAFTSELAVVSITLLGIESVSTSVMLQGTGQDANFGTDSPVLTISGEGVFDQTEFDPGGSGSIGFSAFGPGSYTLSANAPGFLEAVRTGVVLGAVAGAEVILPPVTLLAGDATDDGMIDSSDANVMTDAFGSQFDIGTRRDGEGNIADLNGDGVVNAVDLSLTVSNIGIVEPVSWE